MPGSVTPPKRMQSKSEAAFVSNRDSLTCAIENISKLIENIIGRNIEKPDSQLFLTYPHSELTLMKSLKIIELKGYASNKNDESKYFDSQVIEVALKNNYEYLKKLKSRLLENSSKVLITGDLNSGKSTLINAILQQNILPTDQQPCTQSFCEIVPQQDCICLRVSGYRSVIVDSNSVGEDIVHEKLIEELQDDNSEFKWFKIYAPINEDIIADHKQTVVSFIDSPGLNTDLFKTASLFSQQQDIDVVVFVINASFHLTLSGKEFLQKAAQEKEKIFFVVNKFDEIENYRKCKNLITKQIREILPETFEDASNLIHFVSAKQFYLKSMEAESLPSTQIDVNCDDEAPKKASTKYIDNFVSMKKSLLDFIYLKRSVSKLAPAKTYSTRLLQDLLELSTYNLRHMTSEARSIGSKLDQQLNDIKIKEKNMPVLKSKLNEIVMKSSEACSAVTFEYASHFSNEIPNITKFTGFSGIWAIRATVNEKFQRIAHLYSKTLHEIEFKTSSIKRSGLTEIERVAKDHIIDFLSRNDQSELKLCTSIPLYRPSILELFDPREIIHNFGAFNATSVLGAIVGFQPCVNLAWRISQNFGINPILVSAVIIGGVGAFAIYTASSSLEHAVLTKLENFFAQRFNKEIWAKDLSDRCGEYIVLTLSGQSSQVFVTYQRMLENSQQETSSISSNSLKLNQNIDFLKDVNRRIESLLKSCSEIKL